MDNKIVHQFAMRVAHKGGYRIVIVTPENGDDVALLVKAIYHGKMTISGLLKEEVDRIVYLRKKALENEMLTP